MNPKLVKNGAKLALMGIGSLLIGTIIKVERNLGEKLDAKYPTENTDESEQDN